jgi:3-oxoacyl-[acyl-carrier-protein] synthase-3
MLYMNDANYFIPDTYLEVEEAGKLLELEEAHIKVYKKFYGIEKIPVATNIKFVDFIKQPIQTLIEKNNLAKSSIKYLIHCHTAKVIVPFGDSLIRQVKHELELDNAIAFGVSVNNCASAIATIDLLTHVLDADESCKAIMVCGDYAFTHILQLIPNTSILGEGTAAVLFSKQGSKNKLMATAIKVAGEYAEGIWLSTEKAKSFEMQYANLFSTVILEAIQKAGLHKEQIKIIIPHNVNIPSWKRVASVIQVNLYKIYLANVRKYSHCFGADIFINYVSVEEKNILNPGDYYILATVGLGAVFAAAVFQY